MAGRLMAFREQKGAVPLVNWLSLLRSRDLNAYKKVQIALERLDSQGHLLHRPEADYLDDGIYELRIRVGRRNLRLLYFFVGRIAIVISHGFFKEGRVPDTDLAQASHHRALVQADFNTHTVPLSVEAP